MLRLYFIKISNILNAVNNILLPRVCFGCNAHLYRGEQLLCTVCRNNLPLTGYTFTQENEVDRLFYGRIRVEKASSFLFFSDYGIVKNLIHYLKYRNQPRVGVFLGEWYGQVLKEDPGLRIDIVVPVPLHPKKLRKRGYNQVTDFSEALARHLGAEHGDKVLRKTANTRTQTKKGRLARWLGDRDLYVLEQPEKIMGRHVLLVDDVITTGATMETCARTLATGTDTKLYLTSMAVVPEFE